MNKYEELALAIVDYEMVGYYDLIDAYGSEANAYHCIVNDLYSNKIDVSWYKELLEYEEPDEEETVMLNRIIELADEIEKESN